MGVPYRDHLLPSLQTTIESAKYLGVTRRGAHGVTNVGGALENIKARGRGHQRGGGGGARAAEGTKRLPLAFPLTPTSNLGGFWFLLLLFLKLKVQPRKPWIRLLRCSSGKFFSGFFCLASGLGDSLGVGQSWQGVRGRFCRRVAPRRRGFGRWTGKPSARGRRRGGTGGSVTRRPPGRNLRDLRVAVAQPGRAQGGGPGPRGRARGEPELSRAAAWEPGLGTRRGVVKPSGRGGTVEEPRVGLLSSQTCLVRRMCVEPLHDTALT